MKKLIVAICLLAIIVPVFAEQTMTDEEITAAVGRTLRKQVDYEQNLELQKAAARVNFVNTHSEVKPEEVIQQEEEQKQDKKEQIINDVGETILQVIFSLF